MNDFTLPELESVWRWADAHSDKEWYFALAKKIKLMIENYCEHEWGEDPNDGHNWMCLRCGVIEA